MPVPTAEGVVGAGLGSGDRADYPVLPSLVAVAPLVFVYYTQARVDLLGNLRIRRCVAYAAERMVVRTAREADPYGWIVLPMRPTTREPVEGERVAYCAHALDAPSYNWIFGSVLDTVTGEVIQWIALCDGCLERAGVDRGKLDVLQRMDGRLLPLIAGHGVWQAVRN